MTGISEVLTYLRDSATEADIQQVYAVAKTRSKLLRSARAATVTHGQRVRVTGISPKALVGLTGEVSYLNGTHGTVLLSEDSTRILRSTRTKYAARTLTVDRYALTGVPLTCMEPID